jgi:hypothetical protein
MQDSVMYNANTTVINEAFTANLTSATLPLAQFDKMGVHIVWASLTGTIDATVEVQGSNDATNWDNLASAVTLSGANGNDLVMINNAFCSYYRIKATKNSVLGGNLLVIVTLKE